MLKKHILNGNSLIQQNGVNVFAAKCCSALRSLEIGKELCKNGNMII